MTTTDTGCRATASCRERGEWLVSHRTEMDRGEAPWLSALASFDRDQGWAADGQLSAVAWLMWRTDMARATAFEKLRIARELAVRPVVAEALAQGRVSYSAVRIITRIDGPTPAVDAALVDLAEVGSVADVERAVRIYQRYADQERPPPDPEITRSLRVVRNGDGTATVTVSLTELEAEELEAVVQAFIDLRAGDGDPAAPAEPAEQSPRGDGGKQPSTDPWGLPRVTVDWGGRRVDALMDLARTARAHAGDGHAMGAERYLVHVVARHGSLELLDGTPLAPGDVGTVLCDSGRVRHDGGAGAPLVLGRKTRAWSTAQRRAIVVRDRGRCRFPGCEHRITDIHHLRPWEDGGPTDVTNGLLVCAGHHRLLHHGFTAEGGTDGPVTFARPDGSPLGVSEPRW